MLRLMPSDRNLIQKFIQCFSNVVPMIVTILRILQREKEIEDLTNNYNFSTFSVHKQLKLCSFYAQTKLYTYITAEKIYQW